MRQARSLEELQSRYGIRAGSAEAQRLMAYRDLLGKWNRRVNLTASTDWAALGPLFEEGLWAAREYPLEAVDHVDIGSGAGFPALLFKIVRPAMRLRLVESRARRCAFLETAATSLSLPGVEVIHARIEEYLDSGKSRGFDLASWKGLKLSSVALGKLCAAARPEARFWLLHGSELPLEQPEVVEEKLAKVSSHPFPGRKGSRLSIFALRR